MSATKPVFLTVCGGKSVTVLIGNRDYNENLLKNTENNYNNIPVRLLVYGSIANATFLNESIILSLFLF